MKELLDELVSRSGVQTVFVCDRDGRLLASTVSDAQHARNLEPLSDIVGRTNSALRSLKHGELAEMEWVYASGRVLIRGVGDHLLCLICERSINLQLLSMKIEKVQESILSALGSQARQPSSEDIQKLKSAMVAVAQELLAEHAEKVVALLISSEDSLTGLERASEQAEKVTRLFINRKKADEMGARMQALLDAYR
ncbi:MAG: roadblock/LC7 domain-containing protein [Anaerolineales bacterium]|jgi:predicted regulator of Ras-like GTPase activity (Roadblock/LC7/MglB family)